MNKAEFQTVVYPSRNNSDYSFDKSWASVSVTQKITTITIHQYKIKIKTPDFMNSLKFGRSRLFPDLFNISASDKIFEMDVKLIINSGKSKLPAITATDKKLWPQNNFTTEEHMSVVFPYDNKNTFVLKFRENPTEFEFSDRRVFIKIMKDIQK